MKRHFHCSLTVALILLTLTLSPFPALAQEDDESMQDARLLYKSALELKKNGKIDDSVQAYEQAIRKNRSILGEDDNGLIAALKDYYLRKLASAPADLKLLEGMGFICAVGYSDFSNAQKYYEKVIELSPDGKVKERTRNLVERLKLMGESTAKMQDEMASGLRDERLKEWAEMEKNEAAAQENAQNQQQAGAIADLSRSKEEIEARLPQMEDDLKGLEEDRRRAEVLWHSSKDELYNVRRVRLEKELETRRGEVDDLKDKLRNVTKELDSYDAKLASSGQGKKENPASGTPDSNGVPPAPDGVGNNQTNPPAGGETPPPPVSPAPPEPGPVPVPAPEPDPAGNLPPPEGQPTDPLLPSTETPSLPDMGGSASGSPGN